MSTKPAYYPFGLKHNAYVPIRKDVKYEEQLVEKKEIKQIAPEEGKFKYKYNFKEWQDELGLNLYAMDMRQYDPAIARWTSTDPITHYSQSNYTAFDNNPIFWADPSGADGEHYNWDTRRYEDSEGNEVSFEDAMASVGIDLNNDENDDNITVNSDGIVTNVEKNDKPNRFFDENGNELYFHDAEGVDSSLLNETTFSVGDRLYYPISLKQMYDHILKSGLIMERRLSTTTNGFWIFAWYKAAKKGYGSYDFAESYLVNFIDYPGHNTHSGRRSGNITYYSESGYFRFGNQNIIYNLYDAGNYMWGTAMKASGFSYWEARFGSQANEFFMDSSADQRAIRNAFE